MKLSTLIGPPLTRNYRPRGYNYGAYSYSMQRRPIFRIRYVPWMMRDPRIRFGLWLIKGPILAHSRFKVESPNAKLQQFITEQLNRFWRVSASAALRVLEPGFYGAEVLYTQDNEGVIHFDRLRTVYFSDAEPLERMGKKAGIQVNTGNGWVILGGMKSFWHAHQDDIDPWWGQSRLSGAWEPWLDLWKDGGARDIRRLYYYKYAFDGGILYYPVGSTKMADGRMVSNDVLANEMLDRKASGGTMTFPNRVTADGMEAWRYQPPELGGHPVSILEYVDDLRDEEWEGLGIPPEIARAEGTGAYAGRAIPQDAFYSILQEISDSLAHSADEQIFRHLARMNYGSDDYQIIPLPLRPTERTNGYFQPPEDGTKPVIDEEPQAGVVA